MYNACQLVTKQSSHYFEENNIVSLFRDLVQVVDVLKSINYIISALDAEQHCAGIFIDLAKAFDPLHRLDCIGVWLGLRTTFYRVQFRPPSLSAHPCNFRGSPELNIWSHSLFHIY